MSECAIKKGSTVWINPMEDYAPTWNTYVGPGPFLAWDIRPMMPEGTFAVVLRKTNGELLDQSGPDEIDGLFIESKYLTSNIFLIKAKEAIDASEDQTYDMSCPNPSQP